MFFSKSFVTLGLAFLPFAFATIHDVQVGANGLSFDPEAISAEVGDQVVFHFVSKNHTATQSSFDSPCSAKDGGFNSGFMPVPQNQTDNLPIHTISIYDTNPIWVFCAQTNPVNHCGQGMIFAINCGADGSPNSFTNFKQAALNFGQSLSTSAAAAQSTDAGSAGGYGGYGGDSATATADTSAPAATSSPSNSATSGEAGVIKVVVGDSNGDLLFTPANVTADVGTTIMFEFQAKNHSVVQSAFASPCTPINTTTGFKSDFFPVNSSVTEFPTWNITVNSSDPIWAYCRQTNPKSHCGAGMVFSVNAVEGSDKSFGAFQAKAEQQNGTASNGTTGSTTGAAGNGALPSHVSGLGMVLTVVAILASLF